MQLHDPDSTTGPGMKNARTPKKCITMCYWSSGKFQTTSLRHAFFNHRQTYEHLQSSVRRSSQHTTYTTSKLQVKVMRISTASTNGTRFATCSTQMLLNLSLYHKFRWTSNHHQYLQANLIMATSSSSPTCQWTLFVNASSMLRPS